MAPRNKKLEAQQKQQQEPKKRVDEKSIINKPEEQEMNPGVDLTHPANPTGATKIIIPGQEQPVSTSNVSPIDKPQTTSDALNSPLLTPTPPAKSIVGDAPARPVVDIADAPIPAPKPAATESQPSDKAAQQAAEKPAAVTSLNARQQLRKDRAEAAQQRVNEWIERNGRFPSESELEAIIQEDMYAFQKHYNVGHGSNFGTVLGAGGVWGRVNPYTIQKVKENYNTWKADKDAKDRDAAAADREAGDRGPVIGRVTGADGQPHDIRRKDANELVKYIRSLGTDPRDLTPDEVARIQELAKNITGKDILLDKINGAQTMNTVLDAILADGGDSAEDALEMAGITRNDDGSWSVPKQLTYAELQSMREQQRLQDDLRTQQRELERRKARAGLGELGAMIGDVIRGSQGANVASRDTISQIYNQLDANQKQNYDNYVARIEKQRADLRAERQRLADQAFQNEQLEKQHRWDMEKEEREARRQADRDNRLHGFKMDELEATSKAAMERLEKELESKEGIAALNRMVETAKLSVQNQGNSPVVVNGTKYNFDKFTNKTAKSMMYGYIVENMDDATKDVLKNIENKFKAAGLNFDSETSKQAAVVDAFIGSGKLDKNMLDAIEKMAKQLSTSSEKIGGGGTQPTALVFTAGDKKYQKVGGTYIELDADGNATGTPLTAAQFNEIMRGAAGGGNASNNGDSVPSKGNDGGVEEYFTQH